MAGTVRGHDGWPAPLPVVNGMVKVMEWSVMFQAAGPYYFYLGPTTLPSVAGKLAVNYTDGDGAYLTGCMPSSGANDVPVFAAGDTPVRDERPVLRRREGPVPLGRLRSGPRCDGPPPATGRPL
ncbi:MAG: hypothetical protein IPH48_03385 [bacterium]|nr:hypothetical protein [bacterium]